MSADKLIRGSLIALLIGLNSAEAGATTSNPWRNPDATATALSAEPFPFPDELGPAVHFWRQVFGVWSRSQVVLHDDEHMGVIYEVIELPGEVGERQTEEQRAYVDERRRQLQARLRKLESTARARATLSEAEGRLMDRIVQGADRGALWGAAERIRSQRGMRERFRRGVEISGRYISAFRRIFKEAGLPQDLAYLPHVESSFQMNARSSVGAAGVWQFMPDTGRLFMQVNSAVDERMDPILAAHGAAAYLGRAYDRLGDWGLAVTSYNHGVEGVATARAQHGADIGRIVQRYHGRAFGFASRNFYAEFLAVRHILADIGGYFPEGLRLESPWHAEKVRLPRPLTFRQVASLYNVESEWLEQMNPALSEHAIRGSRAIPVDTAMWMPPGTKADEQLLSSFAQASQAESYEDDARAYRVSTADARRAKFAKAKKKVSKAAKRVSKGRTHLVKKGESAQKIAKRYGVSLNRLMVANEISARSSLRAGQRIRIPARSIR